MWRFIRIHVKENFLKPGNIVFDGALVRLNAKFVVLMGVDYEELRRLAMEAKLLQYVEDPAERFSS